MIKSGDCNEFEVEQARIALEAAVRGLVENNGATVTSVTIDPKEIELGKGATEKFTATVTGEGDPTQAVTWTLEGNKHENTVIKPDGTLRISVNETSKSLTVTATSKLDESKSASATVTVTDEVVTPDITVTITPEELKVDPNPGQKGQFTALVEGADNQDVVWTISGNTSGETLITNGQLFLGIDETAEEMTVTATSVENPDCKGTAKVIIERANMTLLQKTYDYAKDLSTEGVTDSAKAYFEKVLAEAKAVLENPAATQEEVDTAWENLLEGIWGLGLTQGDKKDLNSLIAIAEEMIVNKDKYVPDQWELLTKALEDAKRVAADGDAMDEDIQPVSDALLNAIHMQRYKANKANLEDLINKANGLDLSKYTDESVAVLRSALKAANLVMDNESLTNSKQDQAVVNEAAADLKAAIDQLKVKDDSSNPDNPSDPDDGSKPDDGNKPNDGNKPDDGNKGETPTTGDNAPVMAVAGLMLIAGAAMMVVLMRRKADKA